jgi:hypothetical protein
LPAIHDNDVDLEDEDEDDDYMPEKEEIDCDNNNALKQQIEEELASAVKTVSIKDMSKNIIPVRTFYAPGAKIKGADRDAVNNVLGLIAFLLCGTVLSSLDVDVGEDKQDVKVNAHGASELNIASRCMPGALIYKYNPMLFEPIRNAIQTVLNEVESDDSGNPLMKGEGRLPKKCTGDVLPLYKLYLAKQRTDKELLDGEQDEFFLLHQVHIPGIKANETVPAYVGICFFLEDIEQKKKGPRKSHIRLLPGLNVNAPPAAVAAANAFMPPSPMLESAEPSPATAAKRRRGEEEEPRPDGAPSGGWLGGFGGKK